ncbi:MAG: hypothetical protein NTX04_01075 [Verrucomicrobia bacterium]|nr:hypothetical protein [Verrucomicrobiota bacterium]
MNKFVLLKDIMSFRIFVLRMKRRLWQFAVRLMPKLADGNSPERPARPVLKVAYFYQAVASICAASLKLIRIGQDGVQRVLQVALKETQQVVGGSLLVERASAGWFNPLLEIAAMRHERAEERLFIS